MYYVYRKNGGQVVIGAVNQPGDIDTTYFGTIEDASSFDLADGYWSDGVTIRVATQLEKDAWVAAQEADEVTAQKAVTKEVFEGADKMSVAIRAFRAVIVLFVDEINKLRVLHSLPEYTMSQVQQAIYNAIDGE